MSKDQVAYPSVYGVLMKENKVLLMKRQNTCFRNGFYSIPGGRVDDLEPPSKSIIREMKEEVNLNLREEDVNIMRIQHRISNGYACMDFFFLIENFNENDIHINEPEKCEELKWFELDKLPENTITHVKESILAYKGNQFYAEDDFSDTVDDKIQTNL